MGTLSAYPPGATLEVGGRCFDMEPAYPAPVAPDDNAEVQAQRIAVRLRWPDDADPWPGGYANVFAVNNTPWEFTLRAGQLMIPTSAPDTPPEEVAIHATGRLTITPSAFKMLRNFMTSQIKSYEDAYGEILVPEAVGG